MPFCSCHYCGPVVRPFKNRCSSKQKDKNRNQEVITFQTQIELETNAKKSKESRFKHFVLHNLFIEYANFWQIERHPEFRYPEFRTGNSVPRIRYHIGFFLKWL